MFTKKNPKKESSSKLLKLLTKRDLARIVPYSRGLNSDWPSQKKPSLFNQSPKYLKYLHQQNCQQDSMKQNKPKLNIKSQPYNRNHGNKQAATFSTWTTMDFFPTQQSSQHNNNAKIKNNFLKNQSKYQDSLLQSYNSTPVSQIFEEQRVKLNQYQKLGQDIKQINQLPEENSNIYQELNSKYSNIPSNQVSRNSHKKQNTFKQFKQMNQQPNSCNFRSFQDNKQKKSKRLIKTAKVSRQILEPNEFSENYSEKVSKLNSSISSPYLIQPSAFLTPSYDSYPISLNPSLKQISQTAINQPSLYYPLRLKDYQTNQFQAFKVMSQFIDKQMKWEPKRKRPKSSVNFRKYYQR